MHRLLIVSGSGLALSGLLMLYNVVYAEVERNRAEANERLSIQTELLVTAITEPVVIGDYALVEDMLKRRVRRSNMVRISWIDNRQIPVTVEGSVAPLAAPEWFQAWAGLSQLVQSETIVVGGREYGTVSVQMSPAIMVNKLWTGLGEKFEMVLLCVGAFLGLSLAIVANGLRPLHKLANAARHFGKGDLSIRIKPSGPPEMQQTIEAFNMMADGIIERIAKQKESEEALLVEKEHASWQARQDVLTGLANRREFEHQLDELVRNAASNGIEHALLYIDLDQFKLVNDTCGHFAGDELLRQVTTLLQRIVRGGDILARLGGDEFGVLLHGCDLGQAIVIAEKMRHAVINYRFIWEKRVFAVGLSIGVAEINGTGETSSTVLAAADAACYVAKDKGRNRVQAYRVGDGELVLRRGQMEWVSRITEALEKNSFQLHYQRILPLGKSARHAPHYEVLIRMLDDNGQLVPPMAFLPAAERYNLMQGIDRKIVSMAFEAHGNRYRHAPIDITPSLSINLSGSTMGDETFAEFVREQFSRHQISPQIICFEVTETAAIANLSRAAMLIRELREIGCRFSLDDFGSGLSSFAYLKSLPVDYLKIDGGFVKNMASDSIDCAMVQAINDIGHVMGIETVAECVENEFTLDMLKRMGVDHAQGFGIERPRLFEVFESGKDWSLVTEPEAIATAAARQSVTAFFAPKRVASQA